MAGGDVAGSFLFKARGNLPAEVGRQRTAPGKDAALDPPLEAGHLAGISASRRAAPVSEEPSLGTAPSRPCV